MVKERCKLSDIKNDNFPAVTRNCVMNVRSKIVSVHV